MCKAFSITLKKFDLCWFITLIAQSIGSFKQLLKAFYTYWATSKAPKKTSVALVNFQQGRQETLKEYLAHFNSLVLEIKYLDEGIVIHQITMGLQVGHFSLSLAKKPMTSLVNLLV